MAERLSINEINAAIDAYNAGEAYLGKKIKVEKTKEDTPPVSQPPNTVVTLIISLLKNEDN